MARTSAVEHERSQRAAGTQQVCYRTDTGLESRARALAELFQARRWHALFTSVALFRGRSAVVAELQRDAEILLAQRANRLLQFVL